MSTTMRRLGAAMLSLTFIFVAASQTNAQSWRRHRDRDLPAGQKAAVIGGSAAVGAVIGALAGGKKGAIIGGLIGAGAGTAGVLIKDRNNDRNDRYRGYRGYYSDSNRGYYSDSNRGYYSDSNRGYYGNNDYNRTYVRSRDYRDRDYRIRDFRGRDRDRCRR
jgi:hypothetical protein